MSSVFRLIAILSLVFLGLFPRDTAAQGFSALARVVPGSAAAAPRGDGFALTLALTQPVPFRVFTLTDPARLVVDFGELDWTGVAPETFNLSSHVEQVSLGRLVPGWSRLVLALTGPYTIATAEMTTGQPPRLDVILTPATPSDFAAASGAPDSALFRLPDPVTNLPPARLRQQGDRPIVVVLDPGHGGIDPGASRNGVDEAPLMLRFARELREVLLRTGRFNVVLTRESDIFVALERRQSIARAAGADVFISLHADALAEGQARGATVYTLSDTASDLASEKLAERHDRADLLAGLDLSAEDDRIAGILMDLARTETQPRADALADYLVGALGAHVGPLYKRPRLSAAFSVLKAPDIPSVLIELGFLSNPGDLENLLSEDWRARAAVAVRDALLAWAVADAAEAALVRQ